VITKLDYKMINPHVHFRDWKQSYKETIKHGLSVAERIGSSGVFDMPNTSPPIDSAELVEKRLTKAFEINSPVFYGLYMGLTPDPKQICETVKVYREFFPSEGDKVGVIGLKMFAGKSVGHLKIINEDEQKRVYRILTEEGFEGVLAVHCEKESEMNPELWNSSNPISHCYVRPEKAENKSVKDQIDFASEYRFPGNLHILHTSSPKSIRLINEAREKGKIKISCGVTPHHIRLNNSFMKNPETGILYKVNPPLRDKNSAEQMLAFLREGHIDFIETDHAPHTLDEKLNKPFMSGFPGLPYYPHFLNFLRTEGFDDEKIKNLTHYNIEKIFGIKLPIRNVNPDLNLHREYEVDVYDGVR